MSENHLHHYSKTLSIVFVLMISWLCSSGCKHSGSPLTGDESAFKRYPYEKFHLSYEYNGDVRGIEELFVAKHGVYESRYSKFEVFTPQGLRSVESGSLTRFNDVYTIDYETKTTILQRAQTLDSLYHLDVSDMPSPQGYLEAEMRKNYFKSSGIDTLLGKPATRWQQVDGDLVLWVWNSILLKKHASSPNGILEMSIKSIDTSWTVDTSKFAVPSGFRITKK